LREATADRPVVDAAAWASWRLGAAPSGSSATPSADGLRLLVAGAGVDPTPTWLLPPDAPEALPALVSRLLAEPTATPNLDGDQVPIAPVGPAVTTLPGVRTGVLVDLEYAERLSTGDGVLGLPEVWLGPSAPADARARLRSLLAGTGGRLVVSGHIHQSLRHTDSEGLDHLWAPTAWAVLPDDIQSVVGHKIVGVLDLTLHDDGRVDSAVRVPAGVRQATIGLDVDSPYGELPPLGP
jgi:hypothetical protein